MMPEHGVVIGRKEILRPPPRTFTLDHRIDGDIADPDLLHGFRPATIVRSSDISASGAVAIGEWPTMRRGRREGLHP
jgi:hypothetical protein